MRRWLKGLVPALLAVWLQAAADPIEAGFEAYNREAWEEAYGHWIRAAEAGNSEAQFYVSRLFAEGRGVPRDAAESLRWLRYSARGGFPPAQFNLGNSYRAGDGVRQDLSQTIRWWTEAANAGFVQAQYNLALLYFREDGGVRDMGQALAWAEKADAAGSREAAVLIEEIASIEAEQAAATALASGQGIPHERPEAVGSAPPPGSSGPTSPAESNTAAPGSEAMNLGWILDQPPGSYTLQVFSTRSAESAARARGLLVGKTVSGVFPFVRDGDQWYGVVFGSSVRPEEAEAMKSRLPAVFLESRPWVRSFRRVQGAIANLGTAAEGPPATSELAGSPGETAPGWNAGDPGSGPEGADGDAGFNLAWIREQPPDRYTLQVFSTRSRESALRVRGMVDADLPSGVFPFERQDGLWYGVLVGAAVRLEEAEAMKGRLPDDLRKIGPVVRSFGKVQATLEQPRTSR